MIQRANRIFIHVADIDRAGKFYGEILGLKAADAFDGDTAFDAGPVQILLIPDRERGCPKTGADICFWSNDINGDYGRLVVSGVKFFKPPSKERWGGWLAGFFDSDGNRIYLIQY